MDTNEYKWIHFQSLSFSIVRMRRVWVENNHIAFQKKDKFMQYLKIHVNKVFAVRLNFKNSLFAVIRFCYFKTGIKIDLIGIIC